MSRRRKQAEGQKGAPQWMNTYGDMVTLLLTFFVMLFAMSNIDAVKFEQIINSIQGSLGIQRSGISVYTKEVEATDGDQRKTDLDDLMEQISSRDKENDMEDLERIYSQIKAYIQENDLGDFVEITKEKPGLLIRFKENVLFDSGKAALKEGAQEILTDMATIFNAFNKHIRVEGHTDNVPIHNEEFESNWELSAQRAANVVKYFIEENDVDPRRLSLSGYSKYHPVAENSTPEGRQKNRRVDVVILREYILDVISASEGDNRANE